MTVVHTSTGIVFSLGRVLSDVSVKSLTQFLQNIMSSLLSITNFVRGPGPDWHATGLTPPAHFTWEDVC